jgi:hypothetical protein
VRTGSEAGRASPYLEATTSLVELPALERATAIVCVREAGRRLGQAGANGLACQRSLSEVWTELEPATALTLADTWAALGRWQQRPAWPRRVRVEAPALLRLLYPDEIPFSPSDLETYAACPFRYFALHLLRLKELDTDQSRTQYGSLIHHVLESF